MRWTLAWTTVLLLLAGCSGGDSPDDGGDGSDGGDGGDGGGAPSSSGPTGADDGSGRFAVLVADGLLEGEGPEPGAVAACSLAQPSGAIDLEARSVWAKPGHHDFQRGDTWLLVLDRVRVDDPRQVGCTVHKVTSFVYEGQWTPQVANAGVHIKVYADGDGLLIGRNPLAADGEFTTRLEFEDGDYTFTGNVTFHHAGWWPPEGFEERDGADAGEGAIWWDRQDE